MDRDTAKEVMDVALACTRQLHALIPVLKSRLDAQEYEALAKGIALVSVDVLAEMINPVREQYPELYPGGTEPSS